jgi:hypothetical protein
MSQPFQIRAVGNWSRDQLIVRWAASGRRIVPEVEAAIGRAWVEASSRPGIHLFDGPMCRLENFTASPDRLELTLSRTSYRPFLGTNMNNVHFADDYGADVMANPVGLSALLETSDGYLLLGRRNASVAYYPSRIHPFAGALEPEEELDVFSDVERELREELSLTSNDINSIRCIGMAEDNLLRQPELIFHVRASKTREQIESALDPQEHDAIEPIRASHDFARKMSEDARLTPVAAAALTLWAQARSA